MQSHIRHFVPLPRRAVMGLTAAAAAAILAACGGGDIDEPSEFITWQGNANGEIVLDADNGRYKVRNADNKVQSMQDQSILSTYTVTSSGDFYRNGVLIGGVFNITSSTGTKISVFKCSDGRNLNIIETSTTYSYSCV